MANQNSQASAGGLFRSASILSIGNLASRILGLLREAVIARYFGTEGVVSAFVIASQVPTLIYDFLIGGMLSAALVPVLSEQVQKKQESEYTKLLGILFTLFGAVLLLLVLLLETHCGTSSYSPRARCNCLVRWIGSRVQISPARPRST